MRRLAVLSLAILVVAAALLVSFRREVGMLLTALILGEPALLQPVDEGPDVQWADDYYTIQVLDERTWAIGEPRYAQQTYSYLILGEERALLFDSGPGIRDIRPVVEMLTDLPVTAMPSHLHFDHIGNAHRFASVAVIGLPYLRERAPDDRLRPTRWEHLGFIENRPIETLVVTEWVEPGATIQLGGRALRVIHTPGHTLDSVSLFDADRGWLFAGDYLYPGPLIAIVPGATLGDYLRTADSLLASLPPETIIWPAHRSAPPGAPRLERGDLEDLQRTLRAIRTGELSGSGFFPRVFQVNERIVLWADRERLARWD